MTTALQSNPAAPLVLRHDARSVATLTLNRPAALNALSSAMMTELQAAFDAIATDPAIHVVVIAGSGRAFCAGHDLKEIMADRRNETFRALLEQCARLMTSVVRLAKPVVARVHGIATAAGCQLVASCDLAVASTDARFATPGVNIGLFCSTPMVPLSRAVGRKHAMEMLLTGDAIDAATAHRMGLVNRVVAPAALDAAVAELASQIAAKSPLVLAIGKEAFYRQAEMDLDAAYAYAGEVMALNMLKRDAEEGIDAFIQKRPPIWEGR
ncbi:MAG: enoyl-CoA hydratase [Alphaproteobacteria bacterium]|nr:enoyl-CoA hydratase [Alphaproteobacteria bacterium]